MKEYLRPVSGIVFKLIIMVLVFSSNLFSKQSAEYILFNKSAKSTGMGLDTVFSDSSNIFWNSAALSFKENKSLILSNGAINEASTPYLSLNLPGKKFSFGISYWRYNMEISVYDFYGERTGVVYYGGNLFSIAGAMRLKKNLSVGISMNLIEDFLNGEGVESQSYNAIFSNISVLWRLKKINITMGLFNVGRAEFNELEEEIVSGGKLGIGYAGGRINFGFEFGGYGEVSIVGLGGEYRFSDKFTGRTGMLGRGEDSGFGFGFTYRLTRNFNIDFAYQNFRIIGDVGQIGIGYSWGMLKKKEKKKEKEVKRIEIDEVKEGEKINIAVLDFEARPPLSPAEAGFISDFFRADLVRSPILTLVDRNNMEKIFAEQGLQQTGCTTTECAVELGKILNVRYIVTGSCGKLLDKYVITMNVINVETGKIIYSDDRSIDNPNLLRDNIRNMTSDFLNSFK